MCDRRAFFALWPDAAVRREIARQGRSLHGCDGEMLHPLDLHLTLQFLGDIDRHQRCCVEAAAEALRAPPVELQIEQIGRFRRARILWAGPLTSPPALSRLHDQLSTALQPCGFAPEARRFTPHLTLYRKTQGGELGAIAPPISWQAGRLTLACANSTPAGSPRYRIIRQWPLRASP